MSSPILIYQPGGGVPIGPVSNPPVYSQAGTTALIEGQAYVDVVFGSVQTDDEWVLVECIVLNEIDVTPLNIWPGIITDKAQAGFRLQLNGLPDSNNYYVHWAVSGVNITPVPATLYLLSGPTTGSVGVASTFTVSLAPSTTLAGTVTVTPSDGGAGGTFSPITVVLSASSPVVTFTYTPSSYGARTISVTNNFALIDPASLSFTPLASTYTFSGPSSGAYGAVSTPFTVALPVGGEVTGTVTVTPHDGGGGGTFTPASVGLTTAAPSITFTYTPVSSGAKTLSVTNNGGLTDPGNLTYTVGTFDPAAISGLKLWLKADAIAGPPADGATVTAWNDSSANGYNVTGTATFKTNIVNSKPVVRFNGTSQYLINVADISVSQPDTIFVVGSASSPGNESPFLKGAGQILSVFTNSKMYLFAGSVEMDAATISTAFHVFTGIFSGGNGTGYIDGVLRFGPGSVGASGVGVVGILSASGGFYFPGDVAEVLIYNSALGTTDRQNVESYLRTKYATP